MTQIVKFIFFNFQENLNFVIRSILVPTLPQYTNFVVKLGCKDWLTIQNLVKLYSRKAQSFLFILFIENSYDQQYSLKLDFVNEHTRLHSEECSIAND